MCASVTQVEKHSSLADVGKKPAGSTRLPAGILCEIPYVASTGSSRSNDLECASGRPDNRLPTLLAFSKPRNRQRLPELDFVGHGQQFRLFFCRREQVDDGLC